MPQIFVTVQDSLGQSRSVSGIVTLGAGNRIPVPSSIAADGSRDVTQELLAFIMSVPDGSTIVFPPLGRYHVEGGLRMVSTSTLRNLTLEGGGDGTFNSGAQLFVTAPGVDPHSNLHSGRRILYGIGFSSITFRGFRAQGVNYFGPGGWLTQPSMAGPGFGEYFSPVEFEHSYAFANCQQGLVENCSSYGMFGDCVYFAGCQNLVVRNVLGDANGRQGIATNDTRGILIDGFRLLHGRRAGIDLENNVPEQSIVGVEIRNCDILSRLLAITSGGPGDCSNVEIHHNIIRSSGDPVVNNGGGTVRRHDWRIHDNDFQDDRQGPEAGIRMYNTDNIDIRNNRLHFSVRLPIVSYYSCGGTLAVVDNTAPGASGAYRSDIPVTVEDHGNTY